MLAFLLCSGDAKIINSQLIEERARNVSIDLSRNPNAHNKCFVSFLGNVGINNIGHYGLVRLTWTRFLDGIQLNFMFARLKYEIVPVFTQRVVTSYN